MASKNKTETKPKTATTAASATKTPAKAKPAKAKAGAKHVVKAARPPKKYPDGPKAKLAAKHGDRAKLLDGLVGSLARADQDTGALSTTLGKVSNHKLLRLARTAETVKSKYGSRDKLIAAIGTTHNKNKDKDFLTKLDSYSLPQLLDLAAAGERRAKS